MMVVKLIDNSSCLIQNKGGEIIMSFNRIKGK
jgi:hypothetical protein